MYRRTDKLNVVGYADSNFAGCIDTMQSTSGYIYMLVESIVSWKSFKQSITTSPLWQHFMVITRRVQSSQNL